MRASIYNNPLFADGLASLIEQYIGNPEREIDLQRAQLGLEQDQMKTAQMRQDMMPDQPLGNVMQRVMTGPTQAPARTPAAAPVAAPPGMMAPVGDETALIMEEAAEAIRQGADPGAVAARLRELGISTSGR